MHRTIRRAVIGAVVVLLVVAGQASGNADSLAISTLNGQEVADGAVQRPVRGNDLHVAGTAAGIPSLVADAGDSSTVSAGELVALSAIAAGGGSYRYDWSFEGSSERFADSAASRTTFDTTDLEPGPTALHLTVTDSRDRTASDTVQILISAPDTATETFSGDVTFGVPDEELGSGGAVDGESDSYSFRVPDGSTALELELSWQFPENDLDVVASGPSGEHADNIDGATLDNPERIRIDDPVAGTWTATVNAYLSTPDSYKLAITTSRPGATTPRVSTPGPFQFEQGETQQLTAQVTAATAPVQVAWDLDHDAVFETAGATPITDFGLGSHLVTVKATDAAGYEVRETTAVRVVEADTTTTRNPFVVVAVTDSGINPYHREFSAETYPDAGVLEQTEGFTRHPSEYIPGFPTSAEDLPITPVKYGSVPPAADAQLWTRENIPGDELFWIPGTKVIGALDAGDVTFGTPDPRPIFDDHGHGTAAASVAVGNTVGFCPKCLLVFVEDSEPGWVFEQPWIDMVSNSWGQGILGVPGGSAGLFFGHDWTAASRDAANRGQLALFAAGNGVENGFIVPHDTITHEDKGPDWLIRVGANERSTRTAIVGDGNPVDVSSFGSGVIPAAGPTSSTGMVNFGGTSAATPYTTGVFGSVLLRVREALGDYRTGQREVDGVTGTGVIAEAEQPDPNASPYLADGRLTRAELQEAVLKTAEHGPQTVNLVPTGVPGNVLLEGYGIADQDSADAAVDVLVGGEALPDRPLEDAFFEGESALREALYGGWNMGGTNSGSPASDASDRNPFLGLTTLDVPDLATALDLIVDRYGPFRPQAVETAAAAQATGEALTYYLHYDGGEESCSASEPDQYMDTANTVDDDECLTAGTTGLAGGNVGTWPATTALTQTLPAGSTIDGVIYVTTWEPAPVFITATLLAGGTAVGQGTAEAVYVGTPGMVASDYLALPVFFTTDAAVAPGTRLSLAVDLETSATWGIGYEGDHASFVTVSPGELPPAEAGPEITITSPVSGSVVDASETPELSVSGTHSLPEGLINAARTFYLRRDECGAADNARLSRADGPDGGSGCGFVPGASVYGEAIPASTAFPLVGDDLPIVFEDGAITGTLYYSANGSSPVAEISVEVSTFLRGERAVVAAQTVSQAVIDPLADEVPFVFDMPVEPSVMGEELDSLTLTVTQEEAQGGMFLELDDPPAAFDFPIVAPSSHRVEVAFDDPELHWPHYATLGTDGTWGATIDVTALPYGRHNIFARAVAGTAASAVTEVGIRVGEPGEPPRTLVQAQIVPAGASPDPDGWRNAADTSGAGDFGTWTAVLDMSALPYHEPHDVYSRLLVNGQQVSLVGPVEFRRRPGGPWR